MSMRKLMSMRTFLDDPKYMGGVDMLSGDSWRSWRIVLIASMGEALTADERVTFTELTGRDHEPGAPVEELWAIVGRRGGKSRAIAALGAYLASCIDYRGILAPGQFGLVPILSASKEQAAEILNFAVGMYTSAPGLQGLLASEPTAETITLKSRIVLEIRAASFRRARGFTAVGAIGDEVCFWRSDQSANPDVEILNALRPSLATTGGPLIVISSPYAKRGEVYRAFKDDFGAGGDPRILVVKAPSKTMNPSLSQAYLDRVEAKDAAHFSSEYGAEFRNDIDSFISDDVVQASILRGITVIPPKTGVRYVGFVDGAGGTGNNDAMTMGIAFKDGADIVLACVMEQRPPFDPEQVVETFATTLKAYGVQKVTGDKWATGFVASAFRRHGIAYDDTAKPKSDLYRELLPLMASGVVKLLDNQRMLVQLLALERRTARGGKDSIDHPPKGHDDLINAACGAIVAIGVKRAPMVINPEALAWARTPTPGTNGWYQRYGRFN